MTPRQLRFVLAYLETGDRVLAYKRAYDCHGMAQDVVRRKARDVHATPHVAAMAKELRAQALKRNAVSADALVDRLALIAFASCADFAEIKDNRLFLKDFSGMIPEKTAAIKYVRVEADGSAEIQIHSKIESLELLAELLVLFPARPVDDQHEGEECIDGIPAFCSTDSSPKHQDGRT